MALTRKQQRFVAEYLVDFSAKNAAERAGYAPKWADREGWRVLQKPEVKEQIEEKFQALQERTEITAEKVLKEYARVAFTDMRDYLKWDQDGLRWLPSSDLTDDDAAAIAEVTEMTTANGTTTHKFKLHSKISALQDLAKHLQMFKEGPDVNVNVNVNEGEGEANLSVLSKEELDTYDRILAKVEESAANPNRAPQNPN